MSDLVFSPWPMPGHLVAPGSAEVIYLRRALLVLQGTYFNPLTNEQTPLPRHRWVLVHSGTVFSEGNDSDAQGVSTIFDPVFPEGATVGPDDPWELLLVPLYDGHVDSDIYATQGEAFIDVDAGTWVHGSEVQTESPTTPYGRIHERKILRIPVWSTRRKVELGGGFSMGNPNAPDFETTGELKTSELQPFGSHSDPWVMEVDHGWHRTYVQFRFYDHAQKKERPIPPGPLLQSRNELSGAKFGASSVMLDSGSIYMLNCHPEDRLGLLAYQLETPNFARFALEDDTYEQDLDNPHDAVELLGTHYFLPWRWGSRGLEAWEGAVDASADVRKRFSEIRTRGTADNPVCFHLDDMVPGRSDGSALGHQGTRIAVLDHNLAIRQQASNNFGLVPYSDIEVPRFPLRAEEIVFVRGEGQEKMTRVIEYDGVLFELRHTHVRGEPRTSQMVGLRRAEPLTLASERFKSTVAFIDTRYLPIDVGGVTAKRAHLLLHVSCFLTAPAADRVAGDADGSQNEAQTQGVPLAEHLLHTSALQWDQKHPAHGDPSDKKDYFVLPEGGVSEGSTALKIRHLFGSRPAMARAQADAHSNDVNDNISIEIHPQKGRATGGDPMHLYLEYTNVLRAPPVDPHPAASRPYDFEPSGSAIKDRIDEAREKSNTIAHELGHSMELPDEYIERSRPNSDLAGRLPPFSQVHAGYPYQLGAAAFMNSNRHPRLRYAWAHLASLVDHLDSALLPRSHWYRQEGPFFPVYETPSDGSLRHDLPYTIGGTQRFPKWPLWQEPPHNGRVGQSEVNLFPTRRDECLVGPGFTAPSSGILTIPFDGILVVTTKLWFSFDTSLDDEDDRWEVMTDLGLPFQDRAKLPHFYIDTPGAADFKKVLILIQPRFEYGPSPHTNFSGNQPSRTDADIELVVRDNNGSARNVDRNSSPHEVTIRDNDVGNWVWRYSIDPDRWVTTRNNDDLEAGDLTPLATWLGTTLGRAAGTIRSYG